LTRRETDDGSAVTSVPEVVRRTEAVIEWRRIAAAISVRTHTKRAGVTDPFTLRFTTFLVISPQLIFTSLVSAETLNPLWSRAIWHRGTEVGLNGFGREREREILSLPSLRVRNYKNRLIMKLV
jgi:hypothetical protein